MKWCGRMRLTFCIFWIRKTDFPEWIKVSEHRERAIFVASASHPLAGEKHISVERLQKEPLVLTERGISYRYALEQALAADGIALEPFLETGNTDVITRLVRLASAYPNRFPPAGLWRQRVVLPQLGGRRGPRGVPLAHCLACKV